MSWLHLPESAGDSLLRSTCSAGARSATSNESRIASKSSRRASPTDASTADNRRKDPQLGTIVGGKLNPTWVEWLIGWPLGWTDLEPLATESFHEWQRKHGLS